MRRMTSPRNSWPSGPEAGAAGMELEPKPMVAVGVYAPYPRKSCLRAHRHRPGRVHRVLPGVAARVPPPALSQPCTWRCQCSTASGSNGSRPISRAAWASRMSRTSCCVGVPLPRREAPSPPALPAPRRTGGRCVPATPVAARAAGDRAAMAAARQIPACIDQYLVGTAVPLGVARRSAPHDQRRGRVWAASLRRRPSSSARASATVSVSARNARSRSNTSK